MNDKIRECPACDSSLVSVADRCLYVICGNCHASGPNGTDEESAIVLWNNMPRKSDIFATVKERDELREAMRAIDKLVAENINGIEHDDGSVSYPYDWITIEKIGNITHGALNGEASHV